MGAYYDMRNSLTTRGPSRLRKHNRCVERTAANAPRLSGN